MLEGSGNQEGSEGIVPSGADHGGEAETTPTSDATDAGTSGTHTGSNATSEYDGDSLEAAVNAQYEIMAGDLLSLPKSQRKDAFKNYSIQQQVGIAQHLPDDDAQDLLSQLDDEDKRKLGEELAKSMDTDMPEDLQFFDRSIDNIIAVSEADQGELDEHASNQLKTLLKLNNVTQEDGRALLQLKNLSPDTINDIVSELETIESQTEDEDNDTEEVTREKKAELNETGQDMKANLDMANAKLEAEKAANPEKAEEINVMKRKINNLSLKISDFFAEGEPGRKYARLGGKILYIALMTAFIALLLEMNIIYKASRSGRR